MGSARQLRVGCGGEGLACPHLTGKGMLLWVQAMQSEEPYVSFEGGGHKIGVVYSQQSFCVKNG